MSVDTCITTQGDTIQEAVGKALRALNITEDQAEIEVLMEGNKGFLGLGCQAAKVKVRLKEDTKVERELTDILIDLDLRPEPLETALTGEGPQSGLAGLINGQVVVTDPADDKEYATIKPGNHVKICINGQETMQEIRVAQGDEIEVEILHEAPVLSMNLELSEDKTKAFLRISSRPGKRYRLVEHDPVKALTVTAEFWEEIEPPTVSPDDVKRFLHENNVVHGIIDAGCQQAITQLNTDKAVLVAQGLNPGESSEAHPVYEVREVSQATGNISFAGDVEVTGSVLEGCAVIAGGNIVVHGDVTRAVLKAGGSVIVHKMVLGSTIVAGGRAALYTALLPSLREVRDSLEKMYAVAQQLKSAPGFMTSDLNAKGDGPLIQLLMDSKFGNVQRAISEMADMVSAESQLLHEEVARVICQLHASLCNPGPENLSGIEPLLLFGESIDRIMELVESFIKGEFSIRLKYVQNSSLDSFGDIFIDGQGVCVSSLSAGRDVVVSGTPGIARGARLVSGGSITVKELGSDCDTQTSVWIKEKGKLTCGLIHPNVVVQIGDEKCRTDRACRSVEAFLNEDGRIMVNKLSEGN